MNEIRPTKLNLDELFRKQMHSNITTVKSYNTVLERIHKRIKLTSRQRNENKSCWYVVPEVLIGVPKYDVRPCIAYLIQQLEENGMRVQYTHPNLLFISWAHWIPDYARIEFAKQTGTQIDGFGKNVKDKEKKETKFNSIDSYKPTGRFAYSEDLFRKIETKL